MYRPLRFDLDSPQPKAIPLTLKSLFGPIDKELCGGIGIAGDLKLFFYSFSPINPRCLQRVLPVPTEIYELYTAPWVAQHTLKRNEALDLVLQVLMLWNALIGVELD